MGRKSTETGKIRSRAVSNGNVGEALRGLHEYAAGHPQVVGGALMQRLESLEADYERMGDFMLRGFRDEQSDEVYNGLLRSTLELLGDCELSELCLERPAMADARSRAHAMPVDHGEVRRLLEGYVQDIAMQSLAVDEASAAELRLINEKHYKDLATLFNTLLLSPQWSAGERDFYRELLLSPTIDTGDACLLVSAVMLSAMLVADIAKVELLFHIYSNATDENIKQRALVGMTFALPADDYQGAYPEYQRLTEQLSADEQARKDLLELQEQVFLCMDADRDNETIQRDIMPAIMKNQNFRISQFGIEEMPEDPLQDILNPDAADEAMEELEQSIQRMVDMQRNGADIYFGGFSQMKRFSFFYTLCNWFMPFSPNHPALNHVADKLKSSRFLQLLLESGPFCDSDKYSFALAMSTVMERLPDNIRELFDSEDAMWGAVSVGDKQHSGAYLRRMFLQDLYRFFRLYTQKDSFPSPFDYDGEPKYFFFTNVALDRKLLAEQAIVLERFLLKKRHYGKLMRLLDAYGANETPSQQLIVAMLALRRQEYDAAREYFNKVLEQEEGNEQALHGLAKACFHSGRYGEAAEHYGKLSLLTPENMQYELNGCISMIHSGQIPDGVQRLFKMYYEHPEDMNVCRALAWGLLMQGTAKQAERLYETLLGSEEAIAGDFLNAGYCKWFGNNVDEALRLFARYVAQRRKKSRKGRLLDDFASDAELLAANGIRQSEILLMADIAERKANSDMT